KNESQEKLATLQIENLQRLEGLNNENEKLKTEFEAKLKEAYEKLRGDVVEDEQLKSKLTLVRNDQAALLEDILKSKATMMKTLSQDFIGKDKESAQSYFDRAMEAILKKNYMRAKYELEQVLFLEPQSQIAMSILGSLNFLLERK
ncbi:MAG: hypothetical protein HY810_06465, partial [Candidatus Omnitrophica bacterium]|nr:hypothetical protein [Candidatus Omnitrophota bacterium]